MCSSGVMQCHEINTPEDISISNYAFEQKTYIYVCDDCPFIGFEYYGRENFNALGKHLKHGKYEKQSNTQKPRRHHAMGEGNTHH